MSETINNSIPVGTRLLAMFLDHVFMTIIVMLFFIPMLSPSFVDFYTTSNIDHAVEIGYLQIFGFSLYFCKDIINGRSIAKRILKIGIVRNSSGRSANSLQTVIRNLFCIVWPIEVIVSMTNTERRIGDIIAETKTIQFNTDQERYKLNIVEILLSLALANGFSLLIIKIVS